MTVKELVTKGAEALNDVPVSGLIKAGIFVGAVVFTAYVLIRHIRRNEKTAHEDPERRRSPVDEILGKANYVADPESFDDMDPLAKKICKKLNLCKRSKKNRQKKSEKVETVSIFDDDAPKSANDFMIRDSKKSRRQAKREESIFAEEDEEMSIGDRIREIGRKMGYAGYDDPGLRRKADRVAKDLGLNVDKSSDGVKGRTVRENPSLF